MLLVASVNVGGLLIARGSARAQEVAVRNALGARNTRLVRLFLVESTLMTALATLLGLAIAFGVVRAIVSLAPADIPRLANASVDLRVLGVTIAVSTLAAIGFGLFPLLQLGRADVHSGLRGTGRATVSGRRKHLQQLLVAGELALAVVLLSGAALLIKSLWKVQQIDPGFESARVLKAEYQLPASRYPSDFRRWPNFAEQHAFTRALLERAAMLPGVETAAIAGNHPLDPGFTNSFTIVGREAEARSWPEISLRRVSPSYFQAVSLPLVRGRLLLDSDTTTARAGRADQRGGGAAVLSVGRSDRRTHAVLGHRRARLSASSRTSVSTASPNRRRLPPTLRSHRRHRPAASSCCARPNSRPRCRRRLSG